MANWVHDIGYFMEADILKPDVYNLFYNTSCLTQRQKRAHRSYLMNRKRELIKDNRIFFNDIIQQKIDGLTKQIKDFK